MKAGELRNFIYHIPDDLELQITATSIFAEDNKKLYEIDTVENSYNEKNKKEDIK